MTELVGASIGNYEITGLVGQGGMGEVYRARHPLLGREVAVKVITPAFSANAEAVSRFRQEAQLVNRVGHAAVVEITDFGVLPDGRCYYVMPLLRGRSLRDHMEQRGILSVAECASIALPVLEALAAVHAAGIVHRDIKPDNVFLDEAPGGAIQPRLLDFGVAKLADPAPGEVGLTRTGQPIGTPLYMAPEQAMGDTREVGPWSDVYSFGVMLFHMLSGRPPYTGQSFLAIAMMHVDAPIPSVRSYQPSVPEPVDWLVQRCMQKQPADRFPHADALRRALQDAATAAPTTALPPADGFATDPTLGAMPSTGLGPTLQPAQSYGGDSSLSGASAEQMSRPPALTAPPAAAATRQSNRTILVLGLLGTVVLLAGIGIFATVTSRSDDKTESADSSPHNASARPADPRAAPRPSARRISAEGMVRVSPGKFLMGDNRTKDARPAHPVTLTRAFYIDRFEVTVRDYERCRRAGKCTASGIHGPNVKEDEVAKHATQCNELQPDRSDHPINCVDLEQAKAYCRFVGKRLPTEAEWEYAARGSDGRAFPWGNQAATCDRAVVGRCSRKSTRLAGTKPVGSHPYARSAFGALDMAGNVWEWVSDGWHSYDKAPAADPSFPTVGEHGILRGGSWDFAASVSKSIYRLRYPARNGHISTGFRCALTASPEVAPPSSSATARPTPPGPGAARISDPERAVHLYYRSLELKNVAVAFRHFCFPRVPRAAWHRHFYSTVGCGRVNSTSLRSRSPSTAVVGVDICVRDKGSTKATRWKGIMAMAQKTGRWCMRYWRVKRAGACTEDCRVAGAP